MAHDADIRTVLNHLVNGTLDETLCRVCFHPLDEQSEHVFTKICKEGKEYCLADILSSVCDMQVAETDKYSVCSKCFISASLAYKFYLKTRHSNELLEMYTDELLNNLNIIEIPEKSDKQMNLCISLPMLSPSTETFDYDIKGAGVPTKPLDMDNWSVYSNESYSSQTEPAQSTGDVDYDNIVIIKQEDMDPLFLKPSDDGSFTALSAKEKKHYDKMLKHKGKEIEMSREEPEKPARRLWKRKPLAYRSCSRCPVKYRFMEKLKKHMKSSHNIDVFMCKVCKAMIEDETEYHNHMKTHNNIMTCAICSAVFRRRDNIIAHLKKHEEMERAGRSAGAHVCEVCGAVLPTAAALAVHAERTHLRRYTCYYCGKNYKVEFSFDLHIKKHEAYINEEKKAGQKQTKKTKSEKEEMEKKKRKSVCGECGKSFVDERALMWHQRLHDNHRPYVCDVCSRAFVSSNRLSQHRLCAHSAPARRCPLCPALFHLRSMVNTHIKKVHLRVNKRSTRTRRYKQPQWQTAPVPINQLSVDVQHRVLELQARQKENYEVDMDEQ